MLQRFGFFFLYIYIFSCTVKWVATYWKIAAQSAKDSFLLYYYPAVNLDFSDLLIVCYASISVSLMHFVCCLSQRLKFDIFFLDQMVIKAMRHISLLATCVSLVLYLC